MRPLHAQKPGHGEREFQKHPCSGKPLPGSFLPSKKYPLPSRSTFLQKHQQPLNFFFLEMPRKQRFSEIDFFIAPLKTEKNRFFPRLFSRKQRSRKENFSKNAFVGFVYTFLALCRIMLESKGHFTKFQKTSVEEGRRFFCVAHFVKFSLN